MNLKPLPANLAFLLPSVLGVALFLIPIEVDGKTTIVIGELASRLGTSLGPGLPFLVVALFLLSALLGWLFSLGPSRWTRSQSLLNQLFVAPWTWLVLRTIAAVFSAATLVGYGPEWMIGENTGAVVLEIAGIIVCILLLANFLLPLLTEFGFLELVGVLLVRPFRIVFNLPGRAGLDAITSWVGDSSVGALLTIRQYEQGFYTAREAAVVVTNFSAVSLPFTVVIVEIANLEVGFLTFYLVAIAVGVVAALITPRLPPLNRVNDEYRAHVEPPSSGAGSIWTHAWQAALARAANAPSIREIGKRGTKSCLDIYIAVLPAAMAVQFVALVINTYSDIFTWLSYPMLPLLYLFGIASPDLVLPGVLVGFLDQFVPAIIATDVADPRARFVLAGLSVTQLIFIAENGAIILRSVIPINLSQLFAIFLLRTIISLPILAAAAYFLH